MAGLLAALTASAKEYPARRSRLDPAYDSQVGPELSHTDHQHLAEAIRLARNGQGRVSPNPLVGAVLVAPEGRVIGSGHHARYGGPHAERAALADCHANGEDPNGATMYVSLEPCAHSGRQPPCTEGILAAGIARVVIASDDPTPKASGKGVKILREAGVEVGVAANGSSVRSDAENLNLPFRKRAMTGMPWVVLKLATSLDGRVALPNGKSRWISGPQSRALAHRWRSELDAVAVGSGTVKTDDPQLTVRADGRLDSEAAQPVRIVFDSEGSIASGSRLMATLPFAPLVVVVSQRAPADRRSALKEAGVDVCVVNSAGSDHGAAGRIDLSQALCELSARDIGSILVEGGPTLAGALVKAQLIDEWRQFIAPVAIGDGVNALSMSAPNALDDAFALDDRVDVDRVGRDILLTSVLRRW